MNLRVEVRVMVRVMVHKGTPGYSPGRMIRFSLDVDALPSEMIRKHESLAQGYLAKSAAVWFWVLRCV